MTTFARIVEGVAVDCQIANDFGELSKRFHPDWLAAHAFAQVPDGTVDGAKDNGDGTFTNPPPIIPAVIPQILSASAFQDLCVAALGGNGVGETRFGAIIRSMSVSADDLVFSVYQRFIKSATFDKTKSAKMFTILVANTIMTAQERAAILNAWPN